MKRAFMVMPFSDDIVRQGYEHCVKPVFKRKGIEIRKADEIFSVNPIYDDIVQEIQNAQIIVVDISTKNTNVFYELGIAHTLKQSQTIILTHDEIKETPFDIAHFRIIHYDNTIEGSTRLREVLERTIDYILADYLTLFGDEYRMVMDVLDYAGKRGALFCLIGLNDTGGIYKATDNLRVEGHYKNKAEAYLMQALEGTNADNEFETFTKLTYTKQEGGSTYVTDKGKGFVEFLKINDYVCDLFNDNVITPGYIPYEKRKKNK